MEREEGKYRKEGQRKRERQQFRIKLEKYPRGLSHHQGKIQPFRTQVPNPRAGDQYWSAAY